ncbi:MAG: HAD hydrolase family protein [Candidatus Cloacimonetes bacterium]|nr:HAD hydrolase family protein [Candidatus Cloacimonadota bacterium]
MLELKIPGWKVLNINHLVLDFNGTLAEDGRILPGIKEKLITLSEKVEIHILTADTHQGVRKSFLGCNYHIEIIPDSSQASCKCQYIQQLGADSVVAVGNGNNDASMLAEAALGIAVIQSEGASARTIAAADIIFNDIEKALETLNNQCRLIASLRC